MGDRTGQTELAYHSIAEQYAKVAAKRSVEAKTFFTRFAARVRSRGLVADLGCGPGDDVRRLLSAHLNAVGLDRSGELLRLAAELSRTTADLTMLPFREASLDGIWSHASLLHVEASDLSRTFAEWNRVLSPGGVIGMTTSLGGESGWELVPGVGQRVPKLDAGHQRWFVHHDKGQVESELAAIGWKLAHQSVRSSHREWLQLIATKTR